MNCRIICLLMLFPLSAFADQVQVYDAYSVQGSLSLYREYSSLERAGSWYRDNLQLMAGLPEAEQDLWMQMMEENLLDRIEREFDQNLSFTGGGRFQNLLEDLNLRWTYQMDGDSVLFDSAGDPLLRSTDRADIEADKTSWKESVEALAEDVLVRWSKNAETLLSSFTSAMTDEFRSRVEDTLTVTMDSWCRMIQDENDRLIRWSSSRMDHRRQRDSYSSRIKSEALSAENLADSLIDDIRDELQESEEALRQGLGINYSVSGELDGDSSDWESLFRKEFTRGLEKWSEAEESFLSERLNWELRAGAE
ncbi:MAG: hypothetical protein PQJ50_01530, partial [Spirochaetales bacterium]|nr:hypothetical protein [Spirochaetales bacterium]